MFDPAIDATNWRAEQALRPAVATRKVWGGNRSWSGADAQQTLASVIRTAQQRRLNPRAMLVSMLQSSTPIDAYISTRKQTHGERPGPCPRGPLPTTATRTDRMTRKLQTKAGAAVYAARKTIVEPVFGQIKQAPGFRHFLLRGLAKVQGERSLVCTTHNVLKLYRLCG